MRDVMQPVKPKSPELAAEKELVARRQHQVQRPGAEQTNLWCVKETDEKVRVS
jgi:hypothetical protein